MNSNAEWGGCLTESQLLESAIGRLGEEEVHEADFEAQPAAIDDEPPPLDVLETDGVDEGGEETGETTEELEHGDTAGALHVWPDFNHVG